MEIAVRLNSDKKITNVNDTNEFGAELQVKLFKDKGWTLVESDPSFSVETEYLWTVRESDNKLVHISTGMTPDEEAKASLAELTKGQLKSQLTDTQVQATVTALTKQNLQLTQDSANYKAAITALTQQIPELKTANATTNTTTKADTNTNTATTTTTTADTNTATTAESK